MGELLVSGSGEDYKAKTNRSTRMLGIIGFAFFLAGCLTRYLLAESLNYSAERAAEVFGFVLIVLGIVFILISGFGKTTGRFACKTRIAVYENAVEGIAYTKLLEGMQEFKLLYSDIKNVDVSRESSEVSAVVLHTQYAKYTCYSKNCDEIRDKIMELVRAQAANMR